MGKYDKYDRTVWVKPRPWSVHPIWRGIGCILLILIPVLSYAGATLLIDANFQNGWLALPRQILLPVSVPFVGRVPHLWANLIGMGLISLAGFGLVTILYAILYRLFGPPPYGPLDSPPLRDHPRRKAR